jgi:outer membrane receptor protein involved in Fe transport
MRLIGISSLGSRAAPLLLALGCCAAMAAPADPASSADQNAGSEASAPVTEQAGPATLGEITVTATRVAEPLSRVPISIAAYSQETLDREGVRSADDLFALTPGVSFDRNGFGLQSTISIRGIESDVGSATTGIYIDDTPIEARNLGNSSGNTYPIIFDLDRVEVLRGPQGTLFGAASEGGTVRFITRQPSLTEYSGYGRAEVAETQGGTPSYEYGAAAGGPIIDGTLGFRLSVYHRRDGGYIDRDHILDPADTELHSNYVDSTALRLAFGWSPVEGLLITPSVLFQQVYQHDTPTVWSIFSDPSSERYISGNGSDSPSHDRFALPALAVKWNLGPVALLSNTSYFDRREASDYDYTLFDISYFAPGGDPAVFYSIPGYYSRSPQGNIQRNFTQELRLQSATAGGRLTWTAGVFYSDASQLALETVESPFIGDYFGAPVEAIFGYPLINGTIAYIDDFDDKDVETAGFANATLKIVDGLKVTAGVRVSRTRFSFTEHKDGPAAGGPSSSAGGEAESPVTPKLGIEWQADSSDLYYASAAKGYRVGGANPPIPSYPGCDAALASLGLQSAPLTYKSDSTWSYEVGAKNRLAGGAIALDSSIYYIDWRNIIQAIPALAQCPFSFTTNLGGAFSKGFDLQAQFLPLSSVTLGVAVGYNDAKYSKTVRAAGATQDLVTAGHTLGGAPWTLTGTGEYRFQGFIGREMYAHALMIYHSQNNGRTAFNDPSYNTYDPLVPNPYPTTELDLRLGTRLDDGLDISLFANNVLNRHTPLDYTRDAVGAEVFHYVPTRPLTVGLTLEAHF